MGDENTQAPFTLSDAREAVATPTLVDSLPNTLEFQPPPMPEGVPPEVAAALAQGLVPQVPGASPPPVAEPAPAAQPSSFELLQQFMQQQSQESARREAAMLQFFAQQQQQFQQMAFQRQAPSLEEAMTAAQLNPADPYQRQFFKQGTELKQALAELRELKQAQQTNLYQQQQQQLASSLAPDISRLVQPFGKLSERSMAQVQATAASFIATGASREDALAYALGPTLEAMKEAHTLRSARPAPTPTQTRGLAAGSVPVGGGGGAIAPANGAKAHPMAQFDNIPVDQLGGALFGRG